ncbi:MAG: 4Fe-4S dicluster domain-containing protein [Lentisphaerae bacterium]|nr:4Fe-4S dicluster domain-containing protein [Lentisphaerota bacterium]MCP4101531.1 4Fe-4S dicluster domain-containing protein [Lentisphaerota bacterium]
MKRFDERDLVVSRIGLTENSKKYENFYTRHPELLDSDRKTRELAMKVVAKNFGVTPEKVKKRLKKLVIMQKIMGSITRLTGIKAPSKFSIEGIMPPEKTREGIAKYKLFAPAIAAAFSINKALGKSKVSKDKVDIGPEKMTLLIKKIASLYGADLVGVAEFKKHQRYSHRGDKLGIGIEYGKPIDASYKYAIVVGAAMDKDMVNRAPKKEIMISSMLEYSQTTFITEQLASYVKSLGYDALTDNFVKYYSPMTPLAAEAGLGQIGRCNMVVNENFGNRVRFAAVLTDLPLVVDKPVDFGMVEICAKCGKCARNCPAKAISFGEPSKINGLMQWEHDENKCFEMWMKVGSDCGVCLSSCPFSQGVDQALSTKMKQDETAIDQIISQDNEEHGKRVFLKEGWPVK